MKHCITVLFSLLFSCAAYCQSIVIARGQSATPSLQTEFNTYANAIIRLYGDAGITVSDIKDTELSDSTLKQARFIVFPYNSALSASASKAVKNAVARGCRILMFYYQGTDLYELLELKQPYLVKKDKLQSPAEIRFSSASMKALPPTLPQPSWNAMHLSPKRGGHATVLGSYRKSDGSDTGFNAVISHPAGFAFAHILLIRDRAATLRMLLSLTAAAIPEIWQTPAKKLLDDIGVIDTCKGLPDLSERLQAFAPGPHSHTLAEAIQIASEARESYEDRQFEASYIQADRARALARQAYLMTCRAKPNELRGAWIHSAYGIGNWGWDKTIRVLKENGFNAIFANMLWGYVADYPSQVLPTHPDVQKKGNQLQLCLDACRKYGVELHVWKVCWNMGHRTPEPLRRQMIKADRTQVTFAGKQTDFLAPHLSENQDLEVAAFLEIIRNYDVDGIHMDYIRYAEEDCDYSASARKAFEAWRKAPVPSWPEDCGIGGTLRREYNEWRRGNINRLVKRVYEEAHALNPAIKVSAAVFGGWDNAPHSNVAQSAETWIENGWLDFVCPMNYTSDKDYFTELSERQISSVRSRIPVYIGIGSYLHPDAPCTAEQIEITRRLGADGFICFSHNPKFADQVLPELFKGPSAKHREPPYPHHSPKVTWECLPSSMPLMGDAYPFPEPVTVSAAFPDSFVFTKGSCGRLLKDGHYLPVQPAISIRRNQQILTCTFIPPSPGVYRLEISDDKNYVSRSPNLDVLSPEDVRQKQIAEGVPQFADNGRPKVAVWQHNAYGAAELLKTLADTQLYDTAPLLNLKPASLAACQVIIIPQPRKHAQLFLNQETAKTLHEFVKNGGRLMATHAMVGVRGFPVICPEVTARIQEPPLKSTRWKPAGHPAAADTPSAVQTTTFVDMIGMVPGPAGKPIAVDAKSNTAVVIAGQCGNGRYAAVGLAIGIDKTDHDCTLPDAEKKLLTGLMNWLVAGE